MAAPFTYPRRVAFVETDAAGLVHFSNFFRYMEEAEAACLRSLDWPMFQDLGGGAVTGFPKRAAQCDYRRPLYFGNLCEIDVAVAELRASAIRWHFTFRLGSDICAEGGYTTVHARREAGGNGIIACLIPDELRSRLQAVLRIPGQA